MRVTFDGICCVYVTMMPQHSVSCIGHSLDALQSVADMNNS